MYERELKNLNAEVHKENEVRKVLNLEVPKLLDIFKTFVGQKLCKADGDLVKKLTDQTSFLIFDRENIKIKPTEGRKYASITNMHITSTDYSARLEVSISFSDGDHTCCYAKGTTYLADIKNGISTSLYAFLPLEMLSAAKEWQKYQKAYKAKETAEETINAMWYGLREWVR